MDRPGSDASTDRNHHVDAVLRKAHEELCDLLQHRRAVTRQIGSVKQTIVGLIKFFGQGALVDDLRIERKSYRSGAGITDSCRRVLMEADRPMSARRVRDLIQQTTPVVPANHKDPPAAVTTVLGRLAQYGEARTVLSADGQRAWLWSNESSLGSEETNNSAPSPDHATG